MSRIAITLMLIAGCLVHSGCARLARRPPRSYTTVVTDSNRDTDEARRQCERAAEYFDKGHLAKAETALHDALIADVSYAPAHNNLGRVYFDRGDLYRAAWEFEYARRLLPESAEVVNNLGMVYEAAGYDDEASEYYGMAMSMDAGNPIYSGNLARALLRADRDHTQVALLLKDLSLNDTRPDWVCWARDQLNLHPQVRAAAHTTPSETRSLEPEPEEIEPLPVPSDLDAMGSISDVPIPFAPPVVADDVIHD